MGARRHRESGAARRGHQIRPRAARSDPDGGDPAGAGRRRSDPGWPHLDQDRGGGARRRARERHRRGVRPAGRRRRGEDPGGGARGHRRPPGRRPRSRQPGRLGRLLRSAVGKNDGRGLRERRRQGVRLRFEFGRRVDRRRSTRRYERRNGWRAAGLRWQRSTRYARRQLWRQLGPGLRRIESLRPDGGRDRDVDSSGRLLAVDIGLRTAERAATRSM